MPEAFKNRLNSDSVSQLGNLFRKAYPEFDYDRFEQRCLSNLENLELKERSHWIAESLWEALPENPQQAFEIARKAILPIPTMDPDAGSEASWLMFPLNSLLSQYGLLDIRAALQLIPEVTKRFTAEFGIRPLLIHKPKSVFPKLRKWAKDPDPNLRRLVSEGTRPRLPWGEQLKQFIADPSPALPLLESLKDDPSEYVRRSVANHLNDIAKDHPNLVLDIVEKWLPDATPHRIRLIKHACRTLIKQGNPRCFRLLGYRSSQLRVVHFKCAPQTLQLGEKLTLDLKLASTAKSVQNCIVDFRFHFRKANGNTAPKVFKGTLLKLEAKAHKHLRKDFHLKPITTRTYYTGSNQIDLLINGECLAQCDFQLLVE